MEQRNVLGGRLVQCGIDPMTGFLRDGCCSSHPSDAGQHFICAKVTSAFLSYSQRVGNDLSTPVPEAGFPGLKDGDRWCLCASRWQQALRDGFAPPVLIAATHEDALEVCSLEDLRNHAVDLV